MALRRPFTLPRQALNSSISGVARSYLGCRGTQKSGLATVVPPVTQDATGSKGPTAMVFMNMGGPSTTDEVESFLSRLFVCVLKFLLSLGLWLISISSFQGRR